MPFDNKRSPAHWRARWSVPVAVLKPVVVAVVARRS